MTCGPKGEAKIVTVGGKTETTISTVTRVSGETVRVMDHYRYFNQHRCPITWTARCTGGSLLSRDEMVGISLVLSLSPHESTTSETGMSQRTV